MEALGVIPELTTPAAVATLPRDRTRLPGESAFYMHEKGGISLNPREEAHGHFEATSLLLGKQRVVDFAGADSGGTVFDAIPIGFKSGTLFDGAKL